MYSRELYAQLLEKNPYFNKSPEERYAIFKSTDPFPSINDALLNSEDILKYVLTAGVIEHFDIENLSGATYNCEFSGKYVYWDDSNVQRSGTLAKDEELLLRQNSITYLEIMQIFRMPEYLVLRFNLQVPHVYKGLLLGTGPIVDPSFRGRLYIPLHNLTSNEYVIKKDASLISVEFTKLSKNSAWALQNDDVQESIVNTLDFSDIYYSSKQVKPDRVFIEYAEKALIEDKLFHKRDIDKIFVSSSIPEAIIRSKEIGNFVENEIKTFRQYSDDFYKSWEDEKQKFNTNIENKMQSERSKIKGEMDQTKSNIQSTLESVQSSERVMKTFSILVVIGLMLSIIGLALTAGWYFSRASELSHATQQICHQQEQIEQHEQEIIDYQIIINELERRISELESSQNP